MIRKTTLGPKQRAIADLLADGSPLHAFRYADGSTEYHIDQYGPVPKDSVERLVARGLLTGGGDGLLGDHLTYRWTPPE